MVAAPWTENKLLLLKMLLLEALLVDEEAPDELLLDDDTVVESGLAVPLLSCFLSILILFSMADESPFDLDSIWEGEICSIANTAAIAA